MGDQKRIDVLMVEQGLVESRSLAQRLIMAGQVRADGQRIHKASQVVDPQAQIEIADLPRFVSRGGEKLSAALESFELEPDGWICADVGASTGGFTDCLLQAGAQRVYAIDVGKGQLHYRLRQDPRVVALEETNVRHLPELPERVDLIVIDVSFISLTYVFPTIRTWLKPTGIMIALIKPQFEAGKQFVGKGGVVRDPDIHADVIRRVAQSAIEQDLSPHGLIRSPLKGPKGNIEFLLLLHQGRDAVPIDDLLSPVVPTE